VSRCVGVAMDSVTKATRADDDGVKPTEDDTTDVAIKKVKGNGS